MTDPQTRELRHEKDRERRAGEIKQAAMTLFSDKGYAGTTIEDISNHTGFGKASLYYYFRNKEEIFSAIVSDTIDKLLGDMENMSRGSGSPDEEMRRIIDHFVREKFEKTGLFQVFHQLQTFFSEIEHPDIRLGIIRKLEQVMNRVKEVMTRGISGGCILAETPETLAGIFMGMIFGAVHFTGMPAISGENKAAYAALLQSIILKGFSPSSNKE